MILRAIKCLDRHHGATTAFATVCLAGVTVYLAYVANKQAAISAEQQEILYRQQMPWVGVVSTIAEAPPQVGKDFVAITTIQNTGTGPALNWRFAMNREAMIAERGGPRDCRRPQPGNVVGTLMPGQQFSIQTTLLGQKLTQEQWERIRDGLDVIYVVGRSDFQDARKERYCLQICMQYWRFERERFGFGSGGHMLGRGAECGD